MEQHMDFEKRLLQVHKPNRVNPQACKTVKGTEITEAWKIVYKEDAGIVVKNAVLDLQDYFQVSMHVSVGLEIGIGPAPKTIFVCVDNALQERQFRIQAADGIVITGADDRYTAQGCFALEDELNLNEAPIIAPCDKVRQMRFSFRTIASGMQDKSFPDAHLNMIAHTGITAVDIYLSNILKDPELVKRVNDLTERAANYGLDVYAFPCFKNEMHPEDEGAYEYYDALYGKVAQMCPKIKGYIIVGESCEFPSKDPRTTGKPWRESLDDEKHSPGWFPCSDYPQFVTMLQHVIRAHAPNAELVFWSYNWGDEDRQAREELICGVPKDITLMTTFEMFDDKDITPQIQETTTDYTLWQIGPSDYYISEATIARERGVKMYCMTNTGGNTWDIGGVPYLPAPQRWIQRWEAVTKAQDELRLDGLRESHSYGFWPSFLPEMAKYAYMTPKTDLHELLDRIIVRDFGKEHLEAVLKAFDLFSEGMSHCVSTNEDQYGPARVGPSYPLFYKRWELIPPCPVTGKEVNYEGYPIYTYNLDRTEKLLYETQEYITMARLFAAGCTVLEGVIAQMEGAKKADAMHILQVAQYIRNNAITIYHMKQWHYLKGKLGVYVDAKPTWVGGRKNMPDAKKAEKPLIPVEDKLPVVLELLEIIQAEIENAKNTIPLVEANSRLGFEQEYGYSCCKEQLLWKIEMAERTITEELLPLLAQN